MKLILAQDGPTIIVYLPTPDGFADMHVDVPPRRVEPGEDYHGIPYEKLAAAGPGVHTFPDPPSE